MKEYNSVETWQHRNMLGGWLIMLFTEYTWLSLWSSRRSNGLLFKTVGCIVFCIVIWYEYREFTLIVVWANKGGYHLWCLYTISGLLLSHLPILHCCGVTRYVAWGGGDNGAQSIALSFSHRHPRSKIPTQQNSSTNTDAFWDLFIFQNTNS